MRTRLAGIVPANLVACCAAALVSAWIGVQMAGNSIAAPGAGVPCGIRRAPSRPCCWPGAYETCRKTRSFLCFQAPKCAALAKSENVAIPPWQRPFLHRFAPTATLRALTGQHVKVTNMQLFFDLA